MMSRRYWVTAQGRGQIDSLDWVLTQAICELVCSH
jgi:hypothetical protein